MKVVSKVDKRCVVFLAVLACLMVAGSTSAFAIPSSQVARTTNVQTITAQCCVLLNPTVRLTEPATVAPVIVTWSADYNVSGTARFGLSLNGGACLSYGPFVGEEPVLIPGSDSITLSGTYQWVVFPSDGLVPGTNTFRLCGGGFSHPITINIGFSTLTVQISK